jgi:hypothetical protein
MLIIIHGWSDNSKSFVNLGKQLVAAGATDAVTHVRLGDYISMDDDVTLDDLADALDKAWTTEGLPTKKRSVDAIVHSTGGLVIRHWMTRFRTPEDNPIHRLLMLAPANFGSHLAHKGRSFLGRVIKGYDSDKPFQTGTFILKGLELGSPFTWDLAEQDRFSKEQWYGPGKVLCTVAVGANGYSGISAAANEAGSDGTVRVSTANLNPVCITMDFAVDPLNPTIASKKPRGLTAFVRIPGVNHGTITLKEKSPVNAGLVQAYKNALTVTDAGFDAWVLSLDKLSEQARSAGAAEAYTQGYQNTVVCLKDDNGAFVKDYFVEMFVKKAGKNEQDPLPTALIQEKVFKTVHPYEDNAAYRSLLINTTVLEREITAKGKALYISITAMPDIGKTGTVGYSTFGYKDIGSIELSPADQRKFFAPDRTALIEITIHREQREKVFTFQPLK